MLGVGTLDEIGNDLSDASLRSAWSQLQSLHQAGIAHRDLRAANLLLDDEGDVWVIDFGYAELSATDDSLQKDLVELLASTVSVVGVDRAVEAAVTVLGPQALTDAFGWIQPLAVIAATRSALGRSGFEELRARLQELLGISAPELPQLARVRPKTVLTIAALGVAIWVILPQVSSKVDSGRVLEAVHGQTGVTVRHEDLRCL